MTTKHPLFDFLPRKVTAEQVQGAIVRSTFSLRFVFLTSLQEGKENPFTRLPHSAQYLKILEARKKLPVFAQMAGFYEMVSPALSFVCEGAIESAPGRSWNQGHASLIPKQSLLNIRLSSWLERQAPERLLSMPISYPSMCNLVTKILLGSLNLLSTLTCPKQRARLLRVHSHAE
jgi:hypothetical protein